MELHSHPSQVLQQITSDQELGGTTHGERDEAVRLSEALAVPLPSSPIAETKKEVESMGDQGEGTARDSDLIAHGVLRGLLETILCPACGQVQTNEATYRCAECKRIYHVRCMGHYAAVGSRTWTYKVTCFLCSMALGVSNPSRAPTEQRQTDQEQNTSLIVQW